MLIDARRLWPTAPVYGWLAEGSDLPIHIDLRSRLPSFSPLDDLGLPANTAWLIAASVFVVFACWLATTNTRMTRRALRRTAAGWLAAACVLGGGWYVANAEYIKPRTILNEVQRWSLPADLDETRGLAFLNGTAYVTAFRSGKLIAIDLPTGTARTLLSSPSSPAGQPSERPGDVQVGPDGLLYVLNNGEAGRALLVLTPDGTIVRQVALDGRSNVMMGLSIEAHGAFHVADMVGGQILTYDPSGGRPLSGWGGLTGGFNNVSGIALAADGSVYAAEASAHRVQQLGADGHALRVWNVDCEPQYVALTGDWVDVTCGATLLSIFVGWGNGYVQRSRLFGGPSGSKLDNPRGLTYGPDGTLYVVDNRRLLQFAVQH
jgi:DNA-binding beta-propeller fold protein YncE